MRRLFKILKIKIKKTHMLGIFNRKDGEQEQQAQAEAGAEQQTAPETQSEQKSEAPAKDAWDYR